MQLKTAKLLLLVTLGFAGFGLAMSGMADDEKPPKGEKSTHASGAKTGGDKKKTNSHAHHCAIRELIQFAHETADHERILDITDELAARLNQYFDGMHKILYPRLIQALKPTELADLRARLNRYWMFSDSAAGPIAA